LCEKKAVARGRLTWEREWKWRDGLTRKATAKNYGTERCGKKKEKAARTRELKKNSPSEEMLISPKKGKKACVFWGGQGEGEAP